MTFNSGDFWGVFKDLEGDLKRILEGDFEGDLEVDLEVEIDGDSKRDFRETLNRSWKMTCCQGQVRSSQVRSGPGLVQVTALK